jgi:hypothetical protein
METLTTALEISPSASITMYVKLTSPMASAFEEIYFIRNDVLLRISMLDVNNEDNKELYEQVLATFILEE